MHGGTNPGAPKGNANARKHGFRSAASIAEQRMMRDVLAGARELLDRSK